MDSPPVATAAERESVSARVVQNIADREGVASTEIDPPLFETIDPDALDALFAPTSRSSARLNGSVVLQYCGYEVTVKAHGRILIDGEDVDPSLAVSSSEEATTQDDD
jgi:hypothetical protein